MLTLLISFSTPTSSSHSTTSTLPAFAAMCKLVCLVDGSVLRSESSGSVFGWVAWTLSYSRSRSEMLDLVDASAARNFWAGVVGKLIAEYETAASVVQSRVVEAYGVVWGARRSRRANPFPPELTELRGTEHE